MNVAPVLMAVAFTATAVMPGDLFAVERGAIPAPTPSSSFHTPASIQAQIGVSIHDYLICVQQGHGNGYPWYLSAQLCLDTLIQSDRHSVSPRPVIPRED